MKIKVPYALAALTPLLAVAAWSQVGSTTTSHDPMPSTGGSITGQRPANPQIPVGCTLTWLGTARLVDVDPISNDILEETSAAGATVSFRVHGSSSKGIVGKDDHSGAESDGVAEIKVRWKYRVTCDSGQNYTGWVDSPTVDVGW